MFAKILPLLFLLVGSGAGVGAGIYLRPIPENPVPSELDEASMPAEDKPRTPRDPALAMDYAKLSNQFVGPIVKDAKVVALVVLALSIEVPEGSNDLVFQKEPKLRDSFLQVLFDHANLGGFDGAFTSAQNLTSLRTALLEIAQRDLGKDVVKDVLILEIARQDY